MRQKSFKAGSEFPPLTKGLLRLYSMRFCSYAQRTRLVLEHLGITHEVVNINLGSKPAWFLERNPRGLVPVLEYDGKVVCESAVCCEYLDKVYNGNQLSPKDPLRHREDQKLEEKYSQVTMPYYNSLFSQGHDKGALDSYHAGLKMFEAELKDRGGTYFGGDKFMLIDFLIWPHMERIAVVHHLVPAMELSKDTYPYLHSWIKRMKTVPAVKQIMLPDEVHIEYLKNYSRGTEDYDMGL